MLFAFGSDLGKELSSALGLDPASVRSIDIHIAAGSVVTAKVELMVKPDAAERLAGLAMKRRWVVLAEGATEDD